MVTKIDFASVSYIIGILSVGFAFFSPLSGLVLGIIGLVQSNKNKVKKAKNMNIAGIVLSLILMIYLIWISIYLGETGLLPVQ
ncbi:MAG: DUF4190 domain-containing protein [Candidatus Pacearchaeota archaeon]